MNNSQSLFKLVVYREQQSIIIQTCCVQRATVNHSSNLLCIESNSQSFSIIIQTCCVQRETVNNSQSLFKLVYREQLSILKTCSTLINQTIHNHNSNLLNLTHSPHRHITCLHNVSSLPARPFPALLKLGCYGSTLS